MDMLERVRSEVLDFLLAGGLNENYEPKIGPTLTYN